MNPNRYLSFGIGAALAFLLALGSVGCLATGFGLEVSMGAVGLVCGLAALGSAFLAGRKWGGVAILCLLTAGIGFFFFSRDAREQLKDLLSWISDFYHRAYGWDWLRHDSTKPGGMEYPLGFLGALVAAQAGWTVVRREDAFPAVLVSLLPLGACLVVTDTVPREGYLYLLILGLLLLILTMGRRHGDEGQANTLTLLAALPLALALWGLFLAVPEESYVNKADAFYQAVLDQFPQLSGAAQDGSTGSTDGALEGAQVDLRKVGPLSQRQFPVMDVSAPVSGKLYLRGQDYDLYDGTGWTATPHRAEVFSGDETFLEARGTVTVATLRELEVCYIPYYAAGGTQLRGGMVPNSQGSTAYGFSLKTLPENWRTLEPGDGADSEPDSRYCQLPEATMTWAESLLETILPEDATVASDKAEIIAAYVRESAAYDANTPRMPGDQQDFARWFLMESDTGYCTHFASATAVLLRAAGVPARYVTGYMFQAQAGTPVTVRADKAHAWVEYYEERLGMWLVLESTPAMAEAPQETEPAATQETASNDTTPATQPEDSAATDASEPEESLQNQESQEAADGASAEDSPKGLTNLVLVVILGSGAAILIWGQSRLRLRLRRRKAEALSHNRRGLAKWQELERLYGRLGQTPPKDLEELAQKARFSQHELTAEELLRLDAGREEALELCRKKPWFRRLADRYFYAAY